MDHAGHSVPQLLMKAIKFNLGDNQTPLISVNNSSLTVQLMNHMIITAAMVDMQSEGLVGSRTMDKLLKVLTLIRQ